MFLKNGRMLPHPPRVLVLILASDTSPIYIEHQQVWRQYMQSNPNVDCYFYKGDPTLSQAASLVGDTLWIRIEDTLDTVYEKTLRAFEFFMPQFPKYKCIFRTNLSSVVVFDRYIPYCRSIPPTRFCSAYIGIYEETPFPAGAGYTITPDVAIRFVKERPPLVCQDDVSVGCALKAWGIHIWPAQRIDFMNKDHVDYWRDRIPENIFHFRVKQQTRHEAGEATAYELEVMKDLVSRYYGVS
jgi:hypothetical protein